MMNTKDQRKRYYLKAASNPDKLARRRERYREYYHRNLERTRAAARQRRARYRSTPEGRLTKILRQRLYDLVKRGKATRGKALSMVGCSVATLRLHLESRFKRGMTWGNYGKRWHIDHVIPCSKFDLTQSEQLAQCFHYSNLQPLWAIHNWAKGDSIQVCQPELLIALGESLTPTRAHPHTNTSHG